MLTLVSHFFSVYLNGFRPLSSTLSHDDPAPELGPSSGCWCCCNPPLLPVAFTALVCYPFNLFFSLSSLCLLLLRNNRLKQLTLTLHCTLIISCGFPLYCVFVCVCVCVCERERERGGEGEREREREIALHRLLCSLPIRNTLNALW